MDNDLSVCNLVIVNFWEMKVDKLRAAMLP